MNILIITQRINEKDVNLGFFIEWLKEFAKFYENVFVISQGKGEYVLPNNVHVFSLGKERGISKLKQLANFYKLLLKNLKYADAVFVHMIPMWAVLGWPIFFIFKKKIYLWYMHKHVGFWLWLAEKIVSKIFTASRESCRVNSDKIIITGHSINTKKFSIFNPEKEQVRYGAGKTQNTNQKFIIFSAGRITQIKNQKILIEAMDILVNKKNIKNFELRMAGEPIMENDFKYLTYLKNFVNKKKLENYVKFLGGVPSEKIAEHYQNSDLFINLSGTGSMDKGVLEAMSCNLNIITSNEAFFNILPKENILKELTPEILAEKINLFLNSGRIPKIEFRDYVIKNHNIGENIKKMVEYMKN